MTISVHLSRQELLECQFAAADRFKRAVAGRIWFAEKIRAGTREEWLRRCAEVANKKRLPCTVTPEEAEAVSA